MCGIVGYVGHRQAAEVILDGLKRLEYRGYDSAGVVIAPQTAVGQGMEYARQPAQQVDFTLCEL